MKKFFLLIIVFAFFIYSCKKGGQDINKSTSSAITGRWSYVKDSVNFYKNGQFSTKQVFTYNTEFMQFNADGTGKNDLTTFTYSLSANKLTLNFSAYNIAGGTVPAESDVATVLELSDHKLYLFYDFIATGNNSIYATLSK